MSPTNKRDSGRVDGTMILLVMLLLGGLGGLGYNVWQMQQQAAWDDDYRNLASSLRVTSQQINVSSREAFSGNEEAFTELSDQRALFPRQLYKLRHGESGSFPAPGPSMDVYLTRIEGDWDTISRSADAILSARTRILFIREVSTNLNTNIKQIQAYYADIVDILSDAPVSSATLLAAQQQLWLIERIGRNIDRILEGGEEAQLAADEFRADAFMFQRNMESLRAGDRSRGINRLTLPEAIETQNLATELYQQVSVSVDEIYNATPELIAAAQASRTIAETIPSLAVSIGNALVHVDQLSDTRQFSATTATYLGIFSFFMMVMIMVKGMRVNW